MQIIFHQNEENNSLRFDMAELQMKLKQYEKAERTVSQALDAENNGSQRSNDLNSLMTQVDIRKKYILRLANMLPTSIQIYTI